MNANAYGGELAKVLEWVDVCAPDGVDRREPDRAGLRVPPLEPDVRARSSRARPSRSPTPTRRQVKATLAEMRGKRREAQPSGIKTFGSTFKNPDDPQGRGPQRRASSSMRPGPAGLEVGGARLSPKHANFVENTGDATTADVLELMARARRLVHERFGVILEPEVQVLGQGRVAGGLGARGLDESGRGRRATPAGEEEPDGLVARFDPGRAAPRRPPRRDAPRGTRTRRAAGRPRLPQGPAEASTEAEGPPRPPPKPRKPPVEAQRRRPRRVAGAAHPGHAPDHPGSLLAASYQLWFRNSSFVAVEKVTVEGVHGPEQGRGGRAVPGGGRT